MKAKLVSRQHGVAVVTALLLTTLAITIVASLFWQQQVQVRSIENQRLQLQKQWILRGALDWSRLILREDKRIAGQWDHLGEPWAVPLAETRLDQYVDKADAETDVPDAVLSGGIVDAQSRLNLSGLVQRGQVDKIEVAAFANLLTYLQINPALAQATADLMMRAAQRNTQQQTDSAASEDAAASQPMGIMHVDDLLAVPGFTQEMLAKVKDFVVVLPANARVNVNTASAEVLAARIDTLTLSEASALVARRQNTWIKDEGDLVTNWLQEKDLGTGSGKISFNSNYFFVNGKVRLNRAGMEIQALVNRSGSNPTVVWVREN